MDSQDALKIFEHENNIVPLSSSDEKVYCFDAEQQKSQTEERPWRNDIYYYEKVEISSIALVKMVMHARSGGDIEVMGIMLGKVVGKTMIVLDAFGLPVESTETRVNAQAEGNEYMVEYIENGRLAGRNEPVIGWYHSHPGYGCWLSGIDVATQKLNQQFTEPFLAVVVDPKRTMSAGKVDLGAFRTFPDNHQAAGTTGAGGNQGNVPLNKIEDFGVHSDKYYSLEVSYFKSSMDQQLMERLWRKHWINTLSQSPLITNNEYTSQKVKDLAEKISIFAKETHKDASYAGILRESDAIAEELAQGHESNKLKMKLFGEL
ncbi:COP9 signalosome catalytic subunit rri1 [Linderina macrospora]|uniref:COP9 signalosome catalytic subunit rri1 n=1 Tax=Linderina macrospora TaxID=4868 RepID=A0ACC1JFY4_9FUNG|nr:COP9 signalosome catalytic subunit rri1 [Linderina macrospora]